jgi:four helix bundle protein
MSFLASYRTFGNKLACIQTGGDFMDKPNDKFQAPNNKQYQSPNNQTDKRFDLEDRTLLFARRVNDYVKDLPKSLAHIENGRQLIRSAGSVGANYIEANEALSQKDFIVRVKIARKEAKESRFWLHLTEPLSQNSSEKVALIKEATELIKILSAILVKSGCFKY